jgi:hypothetical protein
VLIAVMVWNMVSKKEARRSPGCFGGVGGAVRGDSEGFEGEERWIEAMMALGEKVKMWRESRDGVFVGI